MPASPWHERPCASSPARKPLSGRRGTLIDSRRDRSRCDERRVNDGPAGELPAGLGASFLVTFWAFFLLGRFPELQETYVDVGGPVGWFVAFPVAEFISALASRASPVATFVSVALGVTAGFAHGAALTTARGCSRAAYNPLAIIAASARSG